jgi:2-phospho-L-lactate/phosphoenolpyruvate guanylyltransferase
MSVWLVVPVKSLREGKSRLAPALSAKERSALIERLLTGTLEQAARFPGMERTLVVSPCAEVRALAAARGAHVLEERQPGGLNCALRQAQLALGEAGATLMLAVSADLPLLRSDDLICLAGQATAGTVALAPDRSRQGTNGLCLDASAAFDFSFGPNSFERHLECVRRMRMEAAIVHRSGLAFDVDLPEHLAELKTLQPAIASQ